MVAKVNKALDDVRAAEARRMKADGYEPVLKQSRWCLLKRPENLTENQKLKLKDLVRYNLQSVRAYLLKEDFGQLWNYESTAWAAKFLDQSCHQVMRSRIEPMKKVARTLRAHRDLILNYFLRSELPPQFAANRIHRLIEMLDDVKAIEQDLRVGRVFRTRLAYAAHMSIQTTWSVWQRRLPICSGKNFFTASSVRSSPTHNRTRRSRS
jgi:hypothetical protein